MSPDVHSLRVTNATGQVSNVTVIKIVGCEESCHGQALKIMASVQGCSDPDRHPEYVGSISKRKGYQYIAPLKAHHRPRRWKPWQGEDNNNNNNNNNNDNNNNNNDDDDKSGTGERRSCCCPSGSRRSPRSWP